jgi:tRNA nucleotidyltransferase (CCA-adding enzyme)
MSNVTNDLSLRLATMFHDLGKLDYYNTSEENKVCNENYVKSSSDIASSIMKKLKYDRETIEVVKTLILYYDAEILPTSKNIKGWLNKIGIDIFKKILLIKKSHIESQKNLKEENLNSINHIECILNDILEKKQCYNLKSLKVNGMDLIQMGLPKGKVIGEVLNELLDLVINEELENEKEVILNYVSNLKNYLDKYK